MKRRKVKIELEDDEGSKYSIIVEGNLTRDKVMRVFEMMNLLEGSDSSDDYNEAMSTLGDKILKVIEEHFLYGEFTSSDVLEAFEDAYNMPIKLSMISTYLARFVNKGVLTRSRHGKEWRYKRMVLSNKH